MFRIAALFTLIWTLVGCCSTSTTVLQFPPDQLGGFVAKSKSDRLRQDVNIDWEAREDAHEYCAELMGQKPDGFVVACAAVEPDKHRCKVVTPLNTTYSTLGHEIRHCFEGRFHP